MDIKLSLISLYRHIIILISMVVMAISIVADSPMWAFYSVMLIWLNNIIFAFQKSHGRTALLVFQLAFFNFLLGGTFINFIDTGTPLYNFDNSILLHSYLALYISQLFLYISYNFFERRTLTKKIANPEGERKSNIISYIRFASLIIMGITFIPYLLEIYDKIHYVSNNSYADIYLRSSSSLPYPIQKAAQCFAPSFFVYLGTMPSKRKAMLPISMYIFAGALSVLVGARADFARSIMVVFFYFLARDRWANKRGERWFGKKEKLALIALVPILLLFLYNVGNERWDNSEESSSGLNSINSFFVEQGVSVSVIHYAKQYEDVIPNNMYVLGPVINLFIENPVIKDAFGTETYRNQTIEGALYGNRFGDTISYIVMPGRYQLGYGMGSSYIAEVYQSSGYLGLVLINILYGVVFLLIDRFFGRNTWVTAISLLMLYRLIYAPRAATLDFLSNTFNITYIAIFLGIFIIAKMLSESTNKDHRLMIDTSQNQKTL